MANTYHQMYIQTVFPVKYRRALIDKNWRSELFAVMGNLINESGCRNIIVNGVEDHAHCFFTLRPDISVSEVMKLVKAKSSKWINENNLVNHRFEWQKGFGSFTYSKSQVPKVYRYIENQEVHHRKQNFRDEYIHMLESFGIKFDEQYIFHPPL